MEFSEKLKTLRADANLTQNELADKLFVSRQALSNYEQGRSYPSVDILVEMSKLFNTSLDDLLSSGVRRRYIKNVIVLATLLFVCNIANSLSVLFAAQKETVSAVISVFLIVKDIIPFMCMLVYLVFLYSPPKKANKFYGYRTKSSMKNQLTWDYAQLFFGLVFGKISVILWCFAVIFSVISIFIDLNAILALGCALLVTEAVSLVLPVFFVEKKLKFFSRKSGKD